MPWMKQNSRILLKIGYVIRDKYPINEMHGQLIIAGKQHSHIFLA